MAKIDRFMIAPINNGQQTNARPWLIPDDAFESLTDAYIFRGRVRKRIGSKPLNTTVDDDQTQLYSRLRIKIGTTDRSTGNYSGVVPGAIWKIGQAFSVGTTIFTVFQSVGSTLTTGAATATYDTTSGNLVITGNNSNPLTDIYFYPSEPVMGFVEYENVSVNAEQIISFDTQFAYYYTGIAWEQAGTETWTGSDSQFFWSYNWRGVDADDYLLFTTNYKDSDGIKYWNGTTWTKLTPYLTAGAPSAWTLESCRLLVSWKGRLICLNTIENDPTGYYQTYGARARWSQNGTPLISSDADAWRQDIAGKGGFIDAATMEQIVTCGFIKDRLIVYFERSTWELVSTGNDALPFYWQRINEELGSESTFSLIQFDKTIFGVGDIGIHSCNGANVDRIDQKIPDQVFNIANFNQGPQRVAGIRDYFSQLVLWAFPNSAAETYPNQVLVYNYVNDTWSTFIDSITAFGHYQPRYGLRWSNWNVTWEESTWPWASGQEQEEFKSVIAGNQQGFTFVLVQDKTNNSISLQISAAAKLTNGYVELTIPDHNLTNQHYVQVKTMQNTTGINDKIYNVSYVDSDTIYIYEPDYAGAYTGGGTLSIVSSVEILTKQYNFYVEDGRNAYISKVDFYVDSTSAGQVSIDYLLGASNYSLVKNAGSGGTGALVGDSGTLQTSPYDPAFAPFEQQQSQLWHPTYPQAEGQLIQLRIYMTEAQITTPTIAFSDFQLHAMTFYATPTTFRMQ